MAAAQEFQTLFNYRLKQDSREGGREPDAASSSQGLVLSSFQSEVLALEQDCVHAGSGLQIRRTTQMLSRTDAVGLKHRRGGWGPLMRHFPTADRARAQSSSHWGLASLHIPVNVVTRTSGFQRPKC
ncbi:hypothetical protein AAFF_G00284450 [Aldrovandia affinis]|uniref:Uncharacterized protein n=1 Tax=Aldrovandia affinis TaxID=143900 RepID=A0AAD7TAL9_9TELE|nr:hypothetical protein AAFF_G00284450 [Aldrovandia affinis]